MGRGTASKALDQRRAGLVLVLEPVGSAAEVTDDVLL